MKILNFNEYFKHNTHAIEKRLLFKGANNPERKIFSAPNYAEAKKKAEEYFGGGVIFIKDVDKKQTGLNESVEYDTFSSKEAAIKFCAKLVRPEKFSVLFMKDGSYIAATNFRANKFQKNNEGKIIGKFDKSGKFIYPIPTTHRD